MRKGLMFLLFAVAAILLLPKAIANIGGIPAIAKPPTPAPPAPAKEKNTLGQILDGAVSILPLIRDWNSHPANQNVEVSGGGLSI